MISLEFLSADTIAMKNDWTSKKCIGMKLAPKYCPITFKTLYSKLKGICLAYVDDTLQTEDTQFKKKKVTQERF